MLELMTKWLSSLDVRGFLLSSILAVVCIWLLYVLKLERSRRLISKIPGYKNWPLVGDILHLKRDPIEFYPQVKEMLDEVRDLKSPLKLMIGHWAVVGLHTPHHVEKLLRSSILIDKSDDYNFLHKWLGFGLLTSSGNKWKMRRKMLTPSFHFSILKDFLLIMNSHARNLQEKLQLRACDKKEAVDIFPYITLSSLDVVCETAMGVNIDALHNGESDYVNSVYLVKEAIAIRQRSPWYWPSFLYDMLPIGRAVNKGINTMHEYAYKVIRERREVQGGLEHSGRRKAFLDILLECKDEFGNELTDEDIREEVDTFMFEGHDTVSSAISYAVHLLGANPDAQRKCQQELDEILDSPRDFTMDDLSKMTYLEWCIKETLRIFPSVPWFGRALAEDTEFGGYTVPKGTTIVIFAVGLHNDPEIFPDPEKFDPTRFSPENSATRHPYAYVPFSAGPRNCIGQRFAMMELKVLLATILHNFNIESIQRRDEVTPNPGLILQPSSGISVKLASRR